MNTNIRPLDTHVMNTHIHSRDTCYKKNTVILWRYMT